MPTLERHAHLARDADAVWRDIGSFGSIGDWHPMLQRVESDGDAPGATRVAEGTDGSLQVERLEELDRDRRFYRYAMAATPMPVEGYEGEVHVDPLADGTSQFHWSVRFDIAEDGDDRVLEMVRGFLDAGARSLEERYGRAG